jgi:hypothetical protein
VKLGYLVVKWSSPWFEETIASIYDGDHALILSIDNYSRRWPLSRAWNQGIRELLDLGCDTVTVCGDDIILRPETGRLNSEALLASPDLLIVSGRHTPFEVTLDQQPLELRGGCDFACFTLDHRLFEEVGEFDENFDPAYLEDNDMHHRIRVAGYEGMCYAPYFHHLNGTQKSDPQQRELVQRRFPVLLNYYIQKWGGKQGEEVYQIPFNGGPGYVP